MSEGLIFLQKMLVLIALSRQGLWTAYPLLWHHADGQEGCLDRAWPLQCAALASAKKKLLPGTRSDNEEKLQTIELTQLGEGDFLHDRGVVVQDDVQSLP